MCYKQKKNHCIKNHFFAKTPIKSASWHIPQQVKLIVIGSEWNGNEKIPINMWTYKLIFNPF